MDIESKTSIYEEKEETQEVNPEEQKSEIKSEKEKDRVLQTAVIVAVAILVIGGITVARRLSNPQKDTKKGTEILKFERVHLVHRSTRKNVLMMQIKH